MKKPRLLYYSILKYRPDNISFLDQHFDVVELKTPASDTHEILGEVEVILAPLGYFLGPEKMDKCPRLKVIGSNTTGHPHIDVDHARQRGIHVVTLKDQTEFLSSITPTAEHTWGLLLSLTRNLIPAHGAVLEGRWDRRPFGGERMLSRMRMGIAGLGRLGTMVARYALAFGMKVAYYDPHVDSGAPGLTRCRTLEELVSQSDAISIHIPHEPETHGMFNRECLRHFKKGAVLINTSRGELVDHAALLDMLESGHLAGAALDVMEKEFEPGFEADTLTRLPLWEYARNHDNLILTPHIGGSTQDAWYETERHTLNLIQERLRKAPPPRDMILKGETWALIPARGGSKSIPLKNMVPLNHRPLMDYAIETATASPRIQRVICSSDNPEILNFCQTRGVELHPRPDHLSQDHVATIDVILYVLEELGKTEKQLPEFLALFEPTSPFVTQTDIDNCIHALETDPHADSSQTVTQVSSNSHAYNQRYHDTDGSHFLFTQERKICINKQTKPEFFIHGNLRIMRVTSVMASGDLFGKKSIPIPIPRLRAMDVDGPDDLVIAESILASNLLND